MHASQAGTNAALYEMSLIERYLLARLGETPRVVATATRQRTLSPSSLRACQPHIDTDIALAGGVTFLLLAKVGAFLW